VNHCRIADDVEDAVAEALEHVCGNSFSQLLDAIVLVWTSRLAFSNAFALEDDVSELDYGLVVGFRRSFSFFRHLFLLFFVRAGFFFFFGLPSSLFLLSL
jgi:hypothetical protein